MSERAHKAHRILDVQLQLHRIEEWRMSELQRRLDGLEAEQRSLIGALNDDDALQGLFLDAMARRLRALAEETTRVGREREAQAARLADHAGRVASARRLCAGLDREVAQASEKVQLLDSIERHIGRATPASGKIVEG